MDTAMLAELSGEHNKQSMQHTHMPLQLAGVLDTNLQEGMRMQTSRDARRNR